MKYTNIYKTLLPVVFTFLIALPQISHAVPAPIEAKSYQFTKVLPISDTKHKAIMYRKSSTWEDGGTSYNRTHFHNKIAQPVLSFEYNPNEWKVVETDDESQELVSTKYPDLGIIIHGNVGEVAEYKLKRFNVGGSIDYSERETAKLNDWLYIFFDTTKDQELYYQKSDAKYYGTVLPFGFTMYSKNSITDAQKRDLKDIINTVKFSKTSILAAVPEHARLYEQYPVFFPNEEKFKEWWDHDPYSRQNNPEFVVTFPPYLEVEQVNEVYSAGSITELVSTVNPKITFWKVKPGELDFLRSVKNPGQNMIVNTLNRSVLPFDHDYLKDIRDTMQGWLQEKICPGVGNHSDITNLFEKDIQIFSKYFSYESSGNTYDLNLTLDDFEENKYSVYHYSDGNFHVAYPYIRIYALKAKPDVNIDKYNFCLSALSKPYWGYMGYTDGYVLLTEFLPSKNERFNKFLHGAFESFFKNVTFPNNTTDNRPRVDYTTITDRNNPYDGKATYFPIEPKLELMNDPWRKEIIVDMRELFDIQVEEQKKEILDYIATLSDVEETDSKDAFYVGQTEECEQKDVMCIDKGDIYPQTTFDTPKTTVDRPIKIQKAMAAIVLLSILLIIPGLYFFWQWRKKKKIAMLQNKIAEGEQKNDNSPM